MKYSLLIGSITKIKIGHDGSGSNSAWCLSHVIIQSEDTNAKWYFYSSEWYVMLDKFSIANDMSRFSKTEGDGKLSREILASDRALCTYTIMVYTGTAKGAGTDANVFIQLLGEKVCFVGTY